MKYWISWPIGFTCDLGCEYCFHRSSRKDDNLPVTITASEFQTWARLFLSAYEEIIIHPHGGEPFHPANYPRIPEILDAIPDCKVDLLTNGLCANDDIRRFLGVYASRVDRIGLTYHRAKMTSARDAQFKSNVSIAVDAIGSEKIYVKELFLPEYEQEIRENIVAWRDRGISVKVQPFNGWDRGRNFDVKYTHDQYRIIDPEYLHAGVWCTCRTGYTTILIRGGWRDGDVLRCWEDPAIIGNIRELTYNPQVRVKICDDGSRQVSGISPVYAGTYEKDLRIAE